MREAEAELKNWLVEARACSTRQRSRKPCAGFARASLSLTEQLRFDTPPERGTWQRTFETAFAEAEQLIELNERYANAAVDRAERQRRTTMLIAVAGIAITFAAVLAIVLFTRRALTAR